MVRPDRQGHDTDRAGHQGDRCLHADEQAAFRWPEVRETGAGRDDVQSSGGSRKKTQAAKSLVNPYTSSVANNGKGSQQTQALRQKLYDDFRAQGMSATQANALVKTYTELVTKNGTSAAAKAADRTNLIKDFEASGTKAKIAGPLVNALDKAISGNGTAALERRMPARREHDQRPESGPCQRAAGEA